MRKKLQYFSFLKLCDLNYYYKFIIFLQIVISFFLKLNSIPFVQDLNSHSFLDEQLGSFSFFATVTKAAINIGVQIFLWMIRNNKD